MSSKAEVRRAVLLRRRILGVAGAAGDHGTFGASGHRLVAALLQAVGDAALVASYVPLPDEPDPGGLGLPVLLPRLLPNGELAWVRAGGPLLPGLRGTRCPAGAPVPLALADAVVVPALAVDRRGTRLGRGGGSYDRALPAARPGVPVVAVLAHDEELVDELPREAHDVSVTAVVTPSGLHLLGGAGPPSRRIASAG